MITDRQIRNKILRKIRRIPSDKLKDLDDFISKLGEKSEDKSKVLSYAGSWRDIDDSTFQDFTDNLIRNRQRNKRRIDE